MVPFDLLGQAYYSDGLMTDKQSVRKRKRRKREKNERKLYDSP